MTQAPKRSNRWRLERSIPVCLETDEYVLEPLNESCAALDFQALMSCRKRLRNELEWGQWPAPDFTLELNRKDLRRHHDEFERGIAFAFTVLSCDRQRCLGCVYLEQCEEIGGGQLAFWVIDDAMQMEAFLLESVIRWVHEDWSIDRVLVPLRPVNVRGVAIAKRLGLTIWNGAAEDPLSGYLCFLSEATVSVATLC